MKKGRVSFAATFLGKTKDLILVTGGYGIAKQVTDMCEVFHVNDNYWTQTASMNVKRASHSIL